MNPKIVYLVGFFIIFFCCLGNITAQTINVSSPQSANKEYTFILQKGLLQDTIQTGVLGFAGNITLNIPEKDRDFVGIGVLYIEGGSSINMIINNENFSVTQNTDNTYNFENSRENDYLYYYFWNQKKKEDINGANLYADKFIELIDRIKLQNQLLQGMGGLEARYKNRVYNASMLDIDALYSSGLWFSVLDGILRLARDQKSFSDDMIQILDRTKSQEVFEALTENLVVITEQYGWEDAFDIIVPYVESSGRIQVPQGKIYTAFVLSKVRKGMKAPLLDGLQDSMNKRNPDSQKILIAFYQPDCHNCEVEMNLLKKNYQKLQEQGVRVISVSSGTDKERFQQDNLEFPWSDKLCDLEGFAGPNYLNYGILGTPTFFLLDKDWIVLNRSAIFSALEY